MNITNTLQGLKLMLSSAKIFNPRDHFKGKRVAIIGAADSAFEEENGEYIDGFDFIIRINKAPHSLSPEKEKFVGSRTDVLFHSFFESFKDGGGGTIDWDLYSQQGINYVINPNSNLKGLRDHLNYYKRNLNQKTTYILQISFYKKLRSNFQHWVPTVGYSALYSVLNSESKEIYITGFTFFKTPYADDYRDDLKDVKENDKFIEKQGFHNPDLELKEFVDQVEYRKNRATKIVMDPALKSIVDNQIRSRNAR